MEFKQTYMWNEINEAERVISSLYGVNAVALDAIVSKAKENGVKNICLAGRGTSDHALFFFKYAIEILGGYTAGYVAPSVVTMYDGNVDFGGSMVIGVSQSGHAADVIEVIKRANEQGAVTVAVTNDTESPLAGVAQYHVYLNAGKEISVAATKTFTAQLYALLLLACKLSGRNDLLEKYLSLSSRVGGYVKRADELTDVAADKLKGMSDGFVLARGISYALAFESALKLQETCYIRMRGYAMSDFYHGPMAMISEGTNVIVYAPAPSARKAELCEYQIEDQKKSIDKMISLGGTVTLVTDGDALKCYDGNPSVNYLAFDKIGDEYESIFAFALFAQMLACKISCAIGNNPDSPKALNKVTVTK